MGRAEEHGGRAERRQPPELAISAPPQAEIAPVVQGEDDMPATDRKTRLHARRLLTLHGNRAVIVVEEMVAHLVAIGDDERAEEWRRIAAAIKMMRPERHGGCRASP